MPVRTLCPHSLYSRVFHQVLMVIEGPSLSASGAGRRQTRRPSSAKWRLRQIECRARFLQLRLWELSAQEEHFKAELQRLQEQEQQLATADASKAAGSAQPAPAHREPAATGAPAVATEAALKQEPAGDEGILSAASPSARLQAASAAAQPLSKASSMAAEPSMGPRRSQRRRKHERLQAAELVPATLLRHPMFAALAGVSNPAKVGQFSVALFVGCLNLPASLWCTSHAVWSQLGALLMAQASLSVRGIFLS